MQIECSLTPLKFAREHKFTDEQTSVLFTIVHTLITNIKGMCVMYPMVLVYR